MGDYFGAIERRLQDLERANVNRERNGQVVDVKFDKTEKRWYVKMNDGEDLTPSGQDSQDKNGATTFKSDWRPWETFSNGAISFSMPPRKGQRVTLSSPGGNTELGTVRPHHTSKENTSPHDQPDEFVLQVQKPGGDKNETLRFHYTKDKANVTLGDSEWDLKKDRIDAAVDGKQRITVDKGGTRMSNDKGKVDLDKSGRVVASNEGGAIMRLATSGNLLLNSG